MQVSGKEIPLSYKEYCLLLALLEAEGGAYDKAENIVDSTSILADYTVGGTEKPIGTATAGIIGAAAVAGVCAGVCVLLNIFRKKRLRADEN